MKTLALSEFERTSFAVLDGGRLAMGSTTETTVTIWDVAPVSLLEGGLGQRPLAKLGDHVRDVECVTVLDGGRLVSGCRIITIWDPALSDVLR